MTDIGESAFYRCESLTTITLPDSVKTIGENAFYGCKNLSLIKLGKNLVSIAQNAFDGINDDVRFVLPDGCPNFDNEKLKEFIISRANE